MAFLSISEAAIQTGRSRSTIFRAIKNGRISAAKNDIGEYAIDPAELFRVYNPVKGKVLRHATTQQRTQQFTQQQNATDETAATAMETAVKMAELEIEIRMLKQLLEEVKSTRDEIRQDRDEWKGRFERLLTDQRTTAPAPSAKAESMAEILQRMKEKAAAKIVAA